MKSLLPLKIWIVDDDLVAQFNSKIKIRQSGIPCDVFCFDNAHSALVELMDPEIPSNGMPNIIILDLTIPIMECWEFLHQLGIILKKESYPDIFLSSSLRISADINRAKEHAMVKGYFVKPLTPQNMERILKGVDSLREV